MTTAPRTFRLQPGLHSGFTLVELMISIVIALFLCAGMLAVTFSVRNSFRTQDGLTRMQENARFLLSVMNTAVHNAGYYPDPLNTTLLTAFPVPANANPDGTTFSAGQFVTGVTGSGGAGDTLNVRFQSAPGDGLTSCNGDTNTGTVPVVYTNSFSVNALGQLVCAVSIDGAKPSAAAVLIDNVSSMALLFSIDTDADGAVDTYKSATAVSAAALWNTVGAVRITLTSKDLVNSNAAATVNLPNKLVHSINFMNRP